MEYNFKKIEKGWQQKWKERGIYNVSNIPDKPKCYVLDMFPYPSGTGLHVGHPLGYIASDIYARYKRLKGFNVLHPMGYDSFGLPAEQYALETGQHPAVTTENNINTFRSQLENIGFCFDWSREVRTSDPKFYKWTQWIFLQIFNSWYDKKSDKARRIEELIQMFERDGNITYNGGRQTKRFFSGSEWNNFSEIEKQEILMDYRLAYSAFGEVNWCEALGTVLANDEVINGVSERGGHPVEKKKMRQWYLRITDYAERLLQGLNTVDFSDAMKEMQKNWIGKSEGAEIKFSLIPAFSPGGEGAQKEASSSFSPGGEGFEPDSSASSFSPGGKRFEPDSSASSFSPRGEGRDEGEKRGAALVPKYSVANILQFENAKRMRKEFTEAENILWRYLRNSQLNVKFRRQHPIDNYIVDFICLQQKLIIEIDGGYHENEDQKSLDNERTKILSDIGFNVIRFTNKEVKSSIDVVIKKIKSHFEPHSSSSSFSPEGEGFEPHSSASSFSLEGGSLEPHSASSFFPEGEGLNPHSSASSFSPRGEGRDEGLLVYTTRPDTIFGADFMVLAPEHDLVKQVTTEEQKPKIDDYLHYAKSRSERERLAEVKQITGAFTGAYAINPFNGREIPIWISEYVLAGYGTGAIMAVPCGDQRDFNFAKHFNIPITNIIGEYFNGQEANPTKDAILTNSGFLDGIQMKDAISVVNNKLEELGIGKRKINYKMRDAGFSRQRYWGEPFPIVYKNGIAYAVDEKELPVELPHVENYKPGPEGQGPLANIPEWVNLNEGLKRETNTMPGYAGSSWYFLRYMDPHNDKEFADKKITDYWNQVDVYVGGTEHAVGHLLYSRMWTKVLFDLGYISFEEPFKKLVNQGMIQGSSRFVYMISNVTYSNTAEPVVSFSENIQNFIDYPLFISYNQYNTLMSSSKVKGKKTAEIILSRLNVNRKIDINQIDSFGIFPIHVDITIVDGVELNIREFKKVKNGEYANAEFILEDDKVLFSGQDSNEIDNKYICGVEVEKMSKSKYNTVNPNEIIDKYGADTFRMYEMFLGPVEQSKPWDTKGIEGVHRFLKKLWRLFYDEEKGKIWDEDKATASELKVLHKTIKKVEEDTERFSYNTAVSAFMVCVNELTDLKCRKKEILEPLLIILSPYAPHIAAELYELLQSSSPPGERSGEGGVLDAAFPKFDPRYLIESEKEYPVSINGKMRTVINISLEATQPEVEKIVLKNEVVQKWIEGKSPKKIIFVKGKMVNVVI